MTPTIRPYRAEDRAACHDVFYRAVHEGAAAFYTAAQRAAWAPEETAHVTRYDKLCDQWCWVAEDAGAIIGFMSLDHTGYLDMAFVLPEAMGKGVSGALYDALKAKAHEQEFPRLTVHASFLAQRFFEKRGWRVDKVEDHPARGQTLRRFCMSLDVGKVTDDTPL